MDADIRERTLTYLNARHQHPAWLLLASQRAPLVLSCLQTLFDQGRDGVALEDALRALADMLEQYAHNSDLEIENADFYNQARRELRTWIKRTLVVEREGRLYPTDALEEALRFVAALGERIMTSTASRLSIGLGPVQWTPRLLTLRSPLNRAKISSGRRRIPENNACSTCMRGPSRFPSANPPQLSSQPEAAKFASTSNNGGPSE